MADVLLRESLEQMRTHLRANKYSDAFALGQHILHFYPKHIETYTVLAQLCLITNDLAGATDLLRRVLSADPENVIALAGMALISETQDKYDEALWYLERAYEITPSNDELRGELLRVREMFYGATPTRIELTSGALARVYARQGQYAQAINEFRRLLRNDSKRYDARVGLAETLYRAGRTDEAAQIAQSVMADAPFALKPNLILGALWTENAVPEGQQFLQRAHQLDPEHRVARDLLGEQFDGTQAPRLPAIGERAISAPAVQAATLQTEYAEQDSDTARAAALWSEIERAQEPEPALEEPLFADADAMTRVELQALESHAAEVAPAAADIATEQAPAADEFLSLFETPAAAPVIEPETAAPVAHDLDATLQEIVNAEKQKVEQEKIVAAAAIQAIVTDIVEEPPAPPAAEQAPTSPKPPSKFAERLARGKSGEGLSTDAIAAAAAALATSIALDKSNQPSPARRAHPAIPKVRPVIRAAQDKLPSWLRISATPAQASASFDAPATTEAAATPNEDRPDWLVAAEAASVQESITPQAGSDLPDWLKPATATAAPPAASIPTETPKAADVPSWLRDEPNEQTPPAPTPPPAARAAPSVAALPDWLRDGDEAQPPAATITPPAPMATEGWTSAAEQQTIEPAWEQSTAQEPPVVRAETASESSPVLETLAVSEPVAEFETPPARVEPIVASPRAAPIETVPPPPEPEAVDEERVPTQAMPDSATMLQMARDKRAGGDLKGALDLYERVMHRRPNYLDQVTADLQEIIRGEGAPTSANRLLGEAYAMGGRFKESLEQYRIAMGK